MKKIIKVGSNCFIGLISVLLLLLLIINFSSKEDGVAKISHYSFFNVNGDSMDPKIKNGDFIAIDRNVREKYDVGDIVSFLHETSGGYIIVTHRIVDVVGKENTYEYVTKGINNLENDEKVIKNNEIIGEYTNFRIPLLGYVVEFARTSIGYLILVVLPLGLVLLISIYELIKEIEKRKKGEA